MELTIDLDAFQAWAEECMKETDWHRANSNDPSYYRGRFAAFNAFRHNLKRAQGRIQKEREGVPESKLPNDAYRGFIKA